MYAQCPECRTVFRVRAAQLRVAQGRVRCSRCHVTFNALETLREDLPETETAEARAPAPERDPNTPGDLFAEQALTENEALDLEERDEVPPEPERTVPLYQDGGPPAGLDAPPLLQRRRAPWYWTTGAALLALLLGVQAVHAQRGRLAQLDTVGAWLQSAYAALGLSLPPPRDLTRMRVLEAEIVSHPTHPGVLQLSTALVNDAPFPQPWPVLRVRLEDRWGDPVGERFFAPAEYLGQAPETLVPAREDTVVTLDLVDPGEAAVGFLLDTCYPARNGYLCRNNLPKK